jgi:hypothetical protein
MSKRKRGPALIELIHTGEESEVKLPSWWGRRSARRPDESDVDSSRVAEPDSGSDSASAVDRSSAVLFAELRGDRLVFSFTSMMAGIAFFVLVVVVGAGFLIGRQLGKTAGLSEGYEQGIASVSAQTLDEIEAARMSGPKTDIFGGLRTSPIVGGRDSASTTPAFTGNAGAEMGVGSPGSTGSTGTWVSGHTYIVVQEFKASDEDDVAAADLFLREQGVETAILESKGTYRYRLVALKGFNRDDPVQRRRCDEFHDRIRKLGQLFVKAGGRYDLQGYQKKLTADSW